MDAQIKSRQSIYGHAFDNVVKLKRSLLPDLLDTNVCCTERTLLVTTTGG